MVNERDILLSLSLLIGWQLSIWNCCKPFFPLLYNCQLLCFWRLALNTVVEVFPQPFFPYIAPSRMFTTNSLCLIVCPIHLWPLFFKFLKANFLLSLFEKLHHLLFYMSILFSTCCILRCLVCIVVSCFVCIAVVVLCVLLSSYVYLLFYVCIAVFTLDAGLLARSQYSEGPVTGHLDTGFSWFPSVYKQMLRWFPRFQVATTCF